MNHNDIIQSLTNVADLNSGTKVIMILFLYIAPFFMIPTLLKRSGGLLASMSGAIGNSTKGMRDGARKWRANKRKEIKARAQAGKRFKQNNKLAGYGNRAGRMASNFSLDNAGVGINPKTWNPKTIRRNMEQNTGTTTFEAAQKIMQDAYGKALFSDEAIAAAGVGTNDKKVILERLKAYHRQQLEDQEVARLQTANPNLSDEDAKTQARASTANADVTAQSQRDLASVMRVKSMVGAKEYDIAAAISAAGTSSGHSFRYVDGKNGAQTTMEKFEKGKLGAEHNSILQMEKSINAAAGDDRILAVRTLAEARKAGSNAGRTELGGGSFGDAATVMNALYDGKANEQAASKALQQNFAHGTHAQTAVYGKEGGAALFAAIHLDDLQQAGTDQATVARATGQLAAMYDLAGNATNKNADVIAKALQTTVGDEGDKKMVATIIEQARGNAETGQQLVFRRKDFPDSGNPDLAGTRPVTRGRHAASSPEEQARAAAAGQQHGVGAVKSNPGGISSTPGN